MHGDSTDSAPEFLRRFLNAPEEESSRELGALIERFARPVVVRTIRGKLRALGRSGYFSPTGDIEDLFSDACLRIVAKLRALREKPGTESIGDFENYSAVVAINAVHDHLKSNSPKRVSLRNRLRYLLEKASEFTLFQANGELWAAKSGDGTASAVNSAEEIAEKLRGTAFDSLRERVESVFAISNGALKLNDLVRIVGELEGIDDGPPLMIEEWRSAVDVNKTVSGIEARNELKTLWTEIVRLPAKQRTALLLNLADEKRGEMLFMFFNMQIAGIAEIAAALDMTIEECAALLPQLPFEDKRIAAKMGLTPKQVANLRKVARDNLRRRLAGTPRRQRREDKK